MYLMAFIYPSYLYIGIFVYLIPIIITDSHNQYRFRHGYVWGLVFFSGHLIWLAHTIYERGQGNTRMLVYFITICYLALFSGFWFWLKNQLVYRLVSRSIHLKRNRVVLGGAWIISTAIFIYLTCYCSFALLDSFEGYPFIDPLLPLTSWTWYLQPIADIGWLNYWIIILMINVIISNLCEKFDLRLFGALLVFMFFPLCFTCYKKSELLNEDKIVYLQSSWNESNLTASEQFYQIGRKIDQIALMSHEIKFIVMSESAFPHDLLSWEKKLGVWTDLLDEKTSIFIGAHRYQDNKKYNSLYQIQDSRIIAWYDKTHLMPCVERIPWLFKKTFLFAGLFTDYDHVFDHPKNDQSHIKMSGLQPMICSELFCKVKKPDCDKPLIFICNDSWLSLDYAQQLAFRFVKLYSLYHRLSVFYVGSYGYRKIN